MATRENPGDLPVEQIVEFALKNHIVLSGRYVKSVINLGGWGEAQDAARGITNDSFSLDGPLMRGQG
jgi:hypothetical protein